MSSFAPRPSRLLPIALLWALVASLFVAIPSATAQGDNSAPVVDGIPNQFSNVGDDISGSPTATDPDGDAITWSATDLPAGLSIADDGLVTGTLTAAGAYNVVLAADDGRGGVGQMAFTWVVDGDDPVEPEPPTEPGENSAPVITPVPDQFSDVGAIIDGAPSATDADGDTITWTATDLPTGLAMATNGRVTGTITGGGTYNVVMTADDGRGGITTSAFIWTVAGDPEEPEEPTTFFDGPGQLRIPQPLPAGAPGDIIDIEQFSDVSGSTGYRIAYHSTSINGDDVAVSGFVRIPPGTPPAGGWPLIAWAHGTTGIADICAPSINAEGDATVNDLVAAGYAVVATDYEGLGTPGVHPYMVGNSQGRSVLDSVRAAQQLNLAITDEFATLGFSQGGTAALFTGQLQPTYAPELDLIGVAAAAPASNMDVLDSWMQRTGYKAYLIMIAVGMNAAYPELDMADRLTPRGLRDLAVITDTGCLPQANSAYGRLDYESISTTLDPFALPGWGDAMRAHDPKNAPVTQPLLIVQGDADDQVDPVLSASLFDQLCAFDDQGPTVLKEFAGIDHQILPAAGSEIFAFIESRFAGVAAPDQCSDSVRYRNLAQGKISDQSSQRWNGYSWRAVDGNRNGAWTGGSVTHTYDGEQDPWWEVDLAASYSLSKAELWNRTDCCATRLQNVYVFVSETPMFGRSLDELLADPAIDRTFVEGPVGRSINVPLAGTSGRYVRVQMDGVGILSLAEFEAYPMEAT